MRGSVRRERLIEVSADRAWEIVGRPELLHHWLPIDDCEVDGDRRTIMLRSGLRFDEEILTNDPLQRRFQYRIVGGPFREHLASVDVLDVGTDRCVVSYATDADPATMAIILGGAFTAALDALAHQLESGSGPAIDALSAQSTKAGA